MSARDGELNFLHKRIEILEEDLANQNRYLRRDQLEGALLAIGCLTSEMARPVRKAVEEIIALAKPTRPRRSIASQTWTCDECARMELLCIHDRPTHA